VRELFSPWFLDHISDLGSKDSRIELRGKWGVEISEFSAVRRAEIERYKAFFSCDCDIFRAPYEILSREFPRQCVFIGTTNDETPFNDPTGSRRFWPVQCGTIDLESVKQNRGQLWAEAYVRFKRGEPWWLESHELENLAQIEQAKCYERGSRDDLITTWVENPKPRDSDKRHEWDHPELPWYGSNPTKICTTDVLVHGLGLEPSQIRSPDAKEVGRCLRHLGYTVQQERAGSFRGVRYFVKL
jgi:putative DNA primase/helicase